MYLRICHLTGFTSVTHVMPGYLFHPDLSLFSITILNSKHMPFSMSEYSSLHKYMETWRAYYKCHAIAARGDHCHPKVEGGERSERRGGTIVKQQGSEDKCESDGCFACLTALHNIARSTKKGPHFL